MVAKIKYVLPVKGKKVRNNRHPFKPLDAKEPNKVVWGRYWQRRLEDEEIQVVDAPVKVEKKPKSEVEVKTDSEKPKSKKASSKKEKN